jgi:hypothetical protein
VELIGKTITLLYNEKDPARVEAFFNNKSYGMLVPLNVHINCKIRRNKHVTEIIPPDSNKPCLETKNIYRGGSLFEKGN